VAEADWKTIEAAFERARDLTDDARAAFVAVFSREHPALGTELARLLAADHADDAPLRDPIARSAGVLASEATDPWVGKTIGVWTIRRRLASGGMGAVFLAERTDRQFEQQVAIKLMSAQLVALDAVARFKAERQILASLNHPYIAKLYDGGTTDEGLPYLVMEYVEGLPIDRHCHELGLDIEARLDLFCKVCSAVDHAHRHLTVHRDLKPSNILVDANGNPKLLDFGIAKLLDASAANVTPAVTRVDARAMTPEYASPEQVLGEPVSVATDVYTLGVLLYRLMTGRSPYGPSVDSRQDFERAILEQSPRRPSTAVTADEPGAEPGRRAATRKLRRRLAGDLDNVALRALQKEPARRYPTAQALAADIGRYLRHEPVEARADEWPYKARKFVVRNAVSLAVAAVVIGTIASLTAYYTMRLADERDRASLAAAEAKEVATFLTDLFASASPRVAQGQVPTALELLEQGVERVATLDGQPLLQAELYGVMGTSMTALGDTGRSIPLLQRALAMKEAQGLSELDIADALEDLSEAHRQHGESALGEPLLRRALAIRAARLGDDDERVAFTKARLGVLLFDARKHEESLALLQDALAAYAALGKDETSPAIDIRGNIANALDHFGRYDEALALHDETIALSRRIDGELAPNTIIRMSNRGLVLVRIGRIEDAVEQFAEAIRRGEQVWPENADQLAFMTQAQAAAVKRLGRLEESLALYRKAADMTRRGVGENTTLYARRLRGVASVLLDMARYDDAEPIFRAALALSTELGDASNTAQLEVFLGELHNAEGRFVEAEGELRGALARRDALGLSALLVAQRELGLALSEQGKFAEAEPLLLDTLARSDESSGADSINAIGFLAALGAHYRRAGELQRSLVYTARANSLAHLSDARALWTSADGIAEHARTLAALHRNGEAAPLFQEAAAVLTATFGDNDPRVLRLGAEGAAMIR